MKKVNTSGDRGKERNTPQRAALARLLAGNRSHPSAEALHKKLRRNFPGLSLATVYSNLRGLVAAGELAELTFDRDRQHFDPDLSVHGHMFCMDCGRIFDVRCSAPRAARAPGGFKALRTETVFRGYCRRCAAKASKRRTSSCTKKRKKR
ncbi:MAG TPA: transcriptional repressor [Elusimicrobiales bacterium]|nr:transcriptional repressor [Elusimicrobiales bacterium]